LHIQCSVIVSYLPVPASLPHLTQLKSFGFDKRIEHQDVELARALPALQHLTAVRLFVLTPSIAAALPALPRLRSFVCPYGSLASALLPAGAWLAPLRRLVLTAKVITASLGVLATAQQLTLIGSLVSAETTHEQLAQLFEWAGKQTQLRWLGISPMMHASRLTTPQQKQICEAQHCQPDLPIRMFGSYTDLAQEAVMLAPELDELFHCMLNNPY
jgi:hypothetical protein